MKGGFLIMKKYSRISYISITLPILLLVLLFAVPYLARQQVPFVLLRTIYYAQFIGAPLSFILSVIALKKRNEKKTYAVNGLIISLILIVSLAYIVLLAFGIGEA